MRRITRKQKRIIYHVISVLIIAGIALYGAYRNSGVFYRTWEAIRDFGLSIAYYFTELLGFEVITPTVTQFPRDFLASLPEEWETFKVSASAFFARFFSWDNLSSYLIMLAKILSQALTIILLIGVPLVILIAVLHYRSKKVKNKNKQGEPSRALKAYYTMHDKVFRKIKKTVMSYWEFVWKRYKAYTITAIVTAAFFLNGFVIVMEFFAYYFYFVISLDIINLYVQVAKLFSDLTITFSMLPVWIWIVLAVILFDRWRKNIAYHRLAAFERKNRDFIDDLSLVVMTCGSIGTGKTSVMTDMALTKEVRFREIAKEKMLEWELKFPGFPFRKLERMIERGIRHGQICTLVSVHRLFEAIRIAFCHPNPNVARGLVRKLRRNYGFESRDLLFGYRERPEYDNSLKYDTIFEAIETYAKLYFIYAQPTSTIVSNYSIRTDETAGDEGNFILYADDFFRRPAARIEQSRMSHIINFDSMRLGKKMDENGELNNAFEYGVVCITEIGKERGNQKDMEGVKKDAPTANRKNDFFNLELKLIRHSATVDFYPFVQFFCDEQRPDNWGADARDLCDIVYIKGRGKESLMLPFFAVEELLYRAFAAWYERLHDDFYYRRGDETLFMYLFKRVCGVLYSHYVRIVNTFAVKKIPISKRDGREEEATEKKSYYLSRKKIYSDRFSTDCYSGYYVEKIGKSKKGITDIPTYEGLNPTFDELNAQKSLFIDDVSEAFLKGRRK